MNPDGLADDAELILAAAELGISREKAQRMVLTGQLKGYRREGRWYVSRQSLQEELNRRLKASRDHGLTASPRMFE